MSWEEEVLRQVTEEEKTRNPREQADLALKKIRENKALGRKPKRRVQKKEESITYPMPEETFERGEGNYDPPPPYKSD